MSSANGGASSSNNEKSCVNIDAGQGSIERQQRTAGSAESLLRKEQAVGKMPLVPEIKNGDANKKKGARGKVDSSLAFRKAPTYTKKSAPIDNRVPMKSNEPSGGATKAAITTTKHSIGPSVHRATPMAAKPASKPTSMSVGSGSSALSVSKTTNDTKTDSTATDTKKLRTGTPGTNPIPTTATATASKKSQQQSHFKPNPQQQHRYFVQNRQNQEEAVFKMVQNIFKLLETRGGLTMAQLEYNLPILILGSSPSTSISITSQTASAPSSTTTPTSSIDLQTLESRKKSSNATKKQNVDTKKSHGRNSLYDEKLIPENVVPDIVELLVTLGLIQQQSDSDEVYFSRGTTQPVSSSTEADSSSVQQQQQQEVLSAKNHVERQPRFAVHFGKPKQFLVTPTNILSEIAKAQAEIQSSLQRQELLKEVLNVPDQLAAEKIKHIVLQHPQVVDDPVYVTALRNLQVDGMLMAGATGMTAGGNSNSSSSLTNRDGSSKAKSGVGGSGKKVGSGKRRQSGSTPAKRKRQRSKKELPTGNSNVDSGRGGRVAPLSSSVSIGSKPTTASAVPTGSSNDSLSSKPTFMSTGSSPVPPPGTMPLANKNSR